MTFISSEDLHVISLMDRRPFIVSCYKGLYRLIIFYYFIIILLFLAYGQINRQPGIWNPEWLKAYIIVYLPVDHPLRQQTPNLTTHLPAGVSYSVVFRYHSGGIGNDLIHDDPEDDNIDEPNELQGMVWRSHMIDFSVSCWSE